MHQTQIVMNIIIMKHCYVHGKLLDISLSTIKLKTNKNIYSGISRDTKNYGWIQKPF